MKKIIYLVMTATLLFTGCVKDGEDGAPGPAGPQGDDGNANVTSQTYTVYPGNWFYNGVYASYTTSNSNITNPNTDLVTAYVKGSTGAWFSIPTANFLYLGDNMGFSYLSNSVTFYYSYSFSPAVVLDFKVIVVPARLINPNIPIDWSNYDDVRKKLKLKD
ncbi:MAG TPA: hypothetical protein PKN75_01115 [Bacteroidia bacterium]|nr:hypothetical protein [Bacteroidia bacterium]HNU32172.1 hypothetical protein [Bacteroidia bacterium]